MELHEGTDQHGKSYFRVFTHYGRMESLNNDNFNRSSGIVDKNVGGKKECRYLHEFKHAEMVYKLIYEDKTAEYKGYQKVELQSNTTGYKKNNSQLPQNLTTNHQEEFNSTSNYDHSNSNSQSNTNSQVPLTPEVKKLIEMIYHEATNELTSKISARLTTRGIETPLGNHCNTLTVYYYNTNTNTTNRSTINQANRKRRRNNKRN